jgi:hypothetical protein
MGKRLEFEWKAECFVGDLLLVVTAIGRIPGT